MKSNKRLFFLVYFAVIMAVLSVGVLALSHAESREAVKLGKMYWINMSEKERFQLVLGFQLGCYMKSVDVQIQFPDTAEYLDDTSVHAMEIQAIVKKVNALYADTRYQGVPLSIMLYRFKEW